MTSSVTLACAGTGIIGPGGASPVGPIADQTIDVDITLPASATAGDDFDVLVDVDNLTFAYGAANYFFHKAEQQTDVTAVALDSTNLNRQHEMIEWRGRASPRMASSDDVATAKVNES